MPETIRPTNPYRNDPDNLIKKEVPFLEDFAGTTPEELKAAGITETGNDEGRMMNDETNPTSPNQLATPEEIERHENELVECAGIEITRREKTQIEEIVRKLNAERQQNGLEPVELGREIKLYKIEIGGRTKEQLEDELKQASITLQGHAQKILESADFTVQAKKEQNILIKLTVADLGLSGGSITYDIFQKAMELGMDLCPAETGPQWRLQYQDQPIGEWARIGMKQISESVGDASVFGIGRNSDGLCLSDSWAEQTIWWSRQDVFVFRLPPDSSKTKITDQ